VEVEGQFLQAGEALAAAQAGFYITGLKVQNHLMARR
jgi:hypothetical protein